MIRDYPIFVKWFDTLDWILDTSEKFPKSVRFSISGRICNISIDVIEEIIEAVYTANRKPVLKKINLNLEKLRVLFRLCHKRKYISSRQFEHVSQMINETGKMAGGWGRQI